MSQPVLLRFEPLSVRIDTQFWYQLEQRKLHRFKDSTADVPLVGAYATASLRYRPAYQQQSSGAEGMEGGGAEGGGGWQSSSLILGNDAFDAGEGFKLPPFHFRAHGILCNTNTLNELKQTDRSKLLRRVAVEQIWNSAILNGAWLDNPSLLAQFILLTYADLKAHKFMFCPAIPVLLPREPFAISGIVRALPEMVSEPNTLELLRVGYESLRDEEAKKSNGAPHGHPIFLVHFVDNKPQVLPISRWATLPKPVDKQTVWLGVADPSGAKQAVGWTVRNALLALCYQFQIEGEIRVLCFRETPSSNDISQSVVVDVCLSFSKQVGQDKDWVPDSVGWRDNKLTSVDLSTLMDNERLLASSAQLNLGLMKWRMAPELDLDRLAALRCVLVGAGTLGCNVARTLLMWGVTQFTFVDCAPAVSFSNVVRQTLFTFQDAQSRKPKCIVAAEACQRIYPSAKVDAKVMTIPMPGHPIDPKPEARAAVSRDVADLSQLIEKADVVFLLTDSRESRWLPTMLCAVHNRLCINAALGFDSYTVMRHGVRPASSEDATVNVGCYFCSDLTAPLDSMTDRTLDQQCTVARPGLSAIASALAVELMASTLQHPKGGCAPPPPIAGFPQSEDVDPDAELDAAVGALGFVPHQLRGDIYRYQQDMMVHVANTRCVACSKYVREAYAQDGFQFLEQALANPTEVLLRITGLDKEIAKAQDLVDDDVDWDQEVADMDEEKAN